jgi:hypothetical protein
MLFEIAFCDLKHWTRRQTTSAVCVHGARRGHALERAKQGTSDRSERRHHAGIRPTEADARNNEELNRKFAAVISKLSTHDKYFKVVFEELQKLTERPPSSGRQIGFKGRS